MVLDVQKKEAKGKGSVARREEDPCCKGAKIAGIQTEAGLKGSHSSSSSISVSACVQEENSCRLIFIPDYLQFGNSSSSQLSPSLPLLFFHRCFPPLPANVSCVLVLTHTHITQAICVCVSVVFPILAKETK